MKWQTQCIRGCYTKKAGNRRAHSEDKKLQAFCNVATQPERKVSKTTGKAYYEFRAAESQRGVDGDPCWFTVRVMKPEKPQLDKGDFVKITGKLKADFYLSRDGKPTGTLLILAFEAAKIGKLAPAGTEQVQ